jgi:hypothetical protein
MTRFERPTTSPRDYQRRMSCRMHVRNVPREILPRTLRDRTKGHARKRGNFPFRYQSGSFRPVHCCIFSTPDMKIFDPSLWQYQGIRCFFCLRFREYWDVNCHGIVEGIYPLANSATNVRSTFRGIPVSVIEDSDKFMWFISAWLCNVTTQTFQASSGQGCLSRARGTLNVGLTFIEDLYITVVLLG